MGSDKSGACISAWSDIYFLLDAHDNYENRKHSGLNGWAKEALISEKTQLETENNALSKKVDLASTIRIKNLTVTPIKEYSADKVTTKSRIKGKINICFTAEANEVVASAEEVFHILIIDPTGIALEQPSSLPTEKLQDTISADSNGKPKVRYTTTATCHYENEEINVCASWQLVERLAKGLYTVEISNKGYLVGKTTFNL